MVRLNKWNREKLHWPILWFTDKAMYQGSSRIPKRGENIGTLKPVIFVMGTLYKGCVGGVGGTVYGSACTVYLGGATGIATILAAFAHKVTIAMVANQGGDSQYASCRWLAGTLWISDGDATLGDHYQFGAWGIAAGVPREPA